MLNFSAALAVLLIALSIIFISTVQMQIFPKRNKKFYSIVNYGKHGVKVEPVAKLYVYDEVKPFTKKEYNYLIEQVGMKK